MGDNLLDLFVGHRCQPTSADAVRLGKSLQERLQQPAIRLSKRRPLRPGESPEFPPLCDEGPRPLPSLPIRRCHCCGGHR